MSTTLPPLPEDPALLQHLLREAQAEITRLQMLIAVLLRNRFGRRSERLGEEALQQGVEDIEQCLGEQAAKLEAAQPAGKCGQRWGNSNPISAKIASRPGPPVIVSSP